MKVPVIQVDEVFHVGTMDRTLKRKGSYEGDGLSVSTHPDAWERINPLTAGDTFSLQKKGSQFLDYHAMSEEEKQCMIDWGVQEGWIQRAKVFQYQVYDDELETEMLFLSLDEDRAKEEADEYEVELEEVDGTVMTEDMKQRVMAYDLETNPLDLLATLYAEDECGLDGVWWADELDVSRYSAPRGVLFNNKLPEWSVRKIDAEATMRHKTL